MGDPFDLTDILSRVEDLHDDLVAHVGTTASGMRMLHHPLVVEALYMPQMNAYLNLRYQAKLKAVDKALDGGDFTTFVMLHEKPYRFDALDDVVSMIDDDAQMWALAAHVWVGSENIFENESGWRELLHCGRPRRDAMMDQDEVARLHAMDDTVQVYRGFQVRGRDQGLSWTTDLKQARWFAGRWDTSSQAKVAVGTVKRDEIIAVMDARNESEVIVLPENVTIDRIDPASRVKAR